MRFTKKLLKRIEDNDLSLTSINLGWSVIGDEGARALAWALKENGALTSISLRRNGIGPEGARCLAQVLERNNTLTSINLEGNKIGYKGLQYLAQALERNSTLTSINLKDNKITHEGAQYLAQALKRNNTLTSINLEDNKIGSRGVLCLACVLEENNTLTSIGLEANRIDNEGARCLVQMLKKNNTLTSITLSSIWIDSTVLAQLKLLLTRNKRLADAKIAELEKLKAALPLQQSPFPLVTTGHEKNQPPRPPFAARFGSSPSRKNPTQAALIKLAATPQSTFSSNPNAVLSFKDKSGQMKTASGPVSTQPIYPGSYEIDYRSLIFSGKILGAGAFGIVRQGKWQYQSVAIKQLLVTSLASHDEQAFREEVAVNVRLRHPNITTFYGACTQSPNYCLVMEYMPGGSLFTFLHNTPPNKISWEQRNIWAKDIGAGLAHLHERGLIHRDLKSLNVLLNDRLRAKLADFGLATIKQRSQVHSSTSAAGHTRHTTTTIHLGQTGTNRWKAPELFKRKAKHSKASDIYAYGCVLWEVASHKVPFEDEETANEGTVAMWIRDGERDDIPTQTPRQYAQLISRCWAQRSSERPSIAAVMQELVTEEVPPPPPPPPSSPPPPASFYEDTLDSMRSGPDYDSVGASQMSRR